MRSEPLAAVLLVLAGCVSPGVYGDGPVEACGTVAEPGSANLEGVETSWVGVEFQAKGRDVEVWVEAEKSDSDFGSQRLVEAWAVAILDPTTTPPTLEAARGGIGRFSGFTTTATVGGQKVYNNARPASDAGDTLELVEHVTLVRGDLVHVYAATTEAVPEVDLKVRWIGCGRTSEVVGGFEPGYAVAWQDFGGTLVLSQSQVGAVAYEAVFREATSEGLLLALSPPGGDKTLYGGAQLTDSQGRHDLREAPAFFVHEGGPVAYEATYAGGGGAATQPLLAWFNLPLTTLEGPYKRTREPVATIGDG